MRYGYNTDFLSEESELSSYFLGFFVADGWLSRITWTNDELNLVMNNICPENRSESSFLSKRYHLLAN